MKKSNIPLISVIICTYNTKLLTLECLKKLKLSIDNFNKPIEVIVVENGTDGTGNFIKKKYPWIKLIEPGENTGFAKGNNLGLKKANKFSTYFLLLNTDVFVNADTLARCFNFIISHPDCDVLGCRLIYKNGKLQPSAGYLPTPQSVVTWAWGLDLIPGLNRLLKPFHPNYAAFFASEKMVGWVTGAFWFFRSRVIKETKGFDENYFMYGEEIDWCKRINDSGYKIWYTPQFEVVHLYAQSSESTRNAFLREIEGIYYYMDKHFPGSSLILKPVVKLGMVIRSLLFFILGNSYRAKVHWDATNIK